MKAKLVTIQMTIRVVVDDKRTDNEIVEKTRSMFHLKINHELNESVVSIVDDLECPYEEKKEIMDRQHVIDVLVDERIRKIREELEIYNDDTQLAVLLRSSENGYDSLTNTELIAEYKKVFNIDIIINHFECNNCDWGGIYDDLAVAMVGNEYNPQDKQLYEIKVCPKCGGDVHEIA